VLDSKNKIFQVNVAKEERSIPKTKDMIDVLRKHTFSASSINTYLRDPMEFYYKYVLGIREQDDLLDEPEAKHVGTFIHELLEDCFKPLLGKKPQVDKTFEDFLMQKFEQRFAEYFEKGMKSDAFMLKTIMKERLQRFCENERFGANRDVKEIMHLEQKFQGEIKLSEGTFKFNYIVDRIDRLSDGTILVIDYKTGGTDQLPTNFARIENMELTRESIFETIGSLQIPLYFHFMLEEFKGEKINACLYNLRTMDIKKFISDRNKYSFEAIDTIFIRALDFVMSEILDPKIQFKSIYY